MVFMASIGELEEGKGGQSRGLIWEEGGLAIGLGVVFMGGGGTGYRAWCGVHGRRGDWL